MTVEGSIEESIAASTRSAIDEIVKPNAEASSDNENANRRIVRSVPKMERVAIGAKYFLKFFTGTRIPLAKSMKVARSWMMIKRDLGFAVSDAKGIWSAIPKSIAQTKTGMPSFGVRKLTAYPSASSKAKEM
jgi:hypothetical protein